MKIKLDWSSKIALLALLALAVFLGNLRFRQWKNQVAIEKEKQNLQEQISSLERKNQELSDSLSYLGSSDFKERVARQQLNLKREGEVVFGFTEPATGEGDAHPEPQAGRSNFEKWVSYFFGTDSGASRVQ